MSESPAPARRMPQMVIALSVAVALAYFFWVPLWHGGGLIGGDIYTYYFPQKTFLAEHLQAGELPLWNWQWGHGYPLVGESQTGVFYPPNFVAYCLFPVNTAYNLVQMAHYVGAFVFVWMYLRKLGFGGWACALAGLVYTYGWFPARISLEWTIIGGVWLPAALWAVEAFLQTRWWRYGFLLSAVLALQMLAGHFNLAFITQLVLVGYIPARLWFASDSIPDEVRQNRVGYAAALGVMMFGAFALAAVQLVPTWELKTSSQRATVEGAFSPGYGRIPYRYLSQIAAPSLWYDHDPNSVLPEGVPPTNRVEAHLYFGWLTLLLLGAGCLSQAFRRDRRMRLWAALGLAALVYATGCLVPIAQYLPGFGFFMGPGRYGIVTTLAAALLAGAALERILTALAARSRLLAPAVGLLCFAVIAVDLKGVGEEVFDRTGYAMVATPPVEALSESPVREILSRTEQPARLFSRGPNLPTLLGVASTPPYLGIGPQQYFDPDTKLPDPLPFDEPPTVEQVDWLRRAGVTHVLSFRELDGEPAWPVVRLWSGVDPFLHRVWGRDPNEPLYLYALQGSRGRVAWIESQVDAAPRIVAYRANRVEIEADSAAGGRVVLTDLIGPGWQVSVDGERADALEIEGMYRGVDLPAGTHTVTWSYAPRSVYWGVAVSLLTAIFLAAIAHVRFWHPEWIEGVYERCVGRRRSAK